MIIFLIASLLLLLSFMRFLSWWASRAQVRREDERRAELERVLALTHDLGKGTTYMTPLGEQ